MKIKIFYIEYYLVFGRCLEIIYFIFLYNILNIGRVCVCVNEEDIIEFFFIINFRVD